MKPRIFNLAAATSLLLCLACLFMWGRSGYVEDVIEQVSSQDWLTFGSSDGGLFVTFLQMQGEHRRTTREWQCKASSRANLRGTDIPGPFWSSAWTIPRYSSSTYANSPQLTEFTRNFFVPYWLPAMATAILPALWFWRRRREKKAACRRGFEVLPAANTAT